MNREDIATFILLKYGKDRNIGWSHEATEATPTDWEFACFICEELQKNEGFYYTWEFPDEPDENKGQFGIFFGKPPLRSGTEKRTVDFKNSIMSFDFEDNEIYYDTKIISRR